MRKITANSINAFLNRDHSFKQSNMAVEKDTSTGFTVLKLHDNIIASLSSLGLLSITNAGWKSNTTKERLNGLPMVSISQSNFIWYLNGKEWGGEWIEIGKIK